MSSQGDAVVAAASNEGQGAVRRTRSVPAKLARSWLLVPATKPEVFSDADRSAADGIILDIEDAVDPSRKPQARDAVVEWLSSGGEAWVRVNDASSEFWGEDLAALRDAPGLQGVMLAKTETPRQVEDTFRNLRNSFPVIALVESAVGIESATDIARADGAFRLAFGSGDFRRDTGMSADKEAMAYPRAKLVVASRCGNLPGPIDGPTVGSSHPVLREQSATTVSMGMTGKLCLDVEQVPVINEVISPTPTDVAWANGFLADFEARGCVIRDGSDLPRLGRARKIAELADAFNVSAPAT
ncbi:HpcH/HpaI aldolase/citrate lyase family protein [Paramicrobacterium agarici]|uniref:HpcH/HpaI aldolase/citrate lyase family protein n=1 Tax=Paramicrobacterium agarici TaxID=630514 RepID=UPI0011508E87|nr:CoA ester lyase [Microbacterium agarici]TQO23708.1 citrate lyase subunit beta/citryl-CoA lyase [Microbacterium agarici]